VASENVPVNKALYARVKAEAKRKFAVYPSAYANAWLVREYKKRGGTYRKATSGGTKKTTKTRWFDEKWVDIKTGKPCGRSKGEKRDYPACRPSKRVSSKTPKTTKEMSPSEKARFKREKTGSKKISYQHRRRKPKGKS
jgi:hypothetical protein